MPPVVTIPTRKMLLCSGGLVHGPNAQMPHNTFAPSAGTRSGTTCRKHPNMRFGIIRPTIWRATTAAGFRAFMMVPGGDETVTGSRDPALLGTFGKTTLAMPYLEYAVV